MNRTLVLFLAIITLSVSGIVYAQGVPVSGSNIVLSSSSDYPYPGDKVVITARSYSFDINSANITWTVDGKIVEKGLGITKLEVTAPPLGKTKAVKISLVTADKQSYDSIMSITSGSVDMILETNGYTPPSFLGKAPIVYQNAIKVIAMPHLSDAKGVEYDPKTLVYEWRKNGSVIESESGYGKQTLSVIGDLVPRAFTISVNVNTRDGLARASGYVPIDFTTPSIKFYVDSQLYGPLLNSSIKDYLYIGKEKETGVLAVPYGFSKPATGLGSLALSWLINGSEHSELASNQSITLRAPDNTQGSSNIELTIKNNRDILQGASAGFTARFNSSNQNNE